MASSAGLAPARGPGLTSASPEPGQAPGGHAEASLKLEGTARRHTAGVQARSLVRAGGTMRVCAGPCPPLQRAAGRAAATGDTAQPQTPPLPSGQPGAATGAGSRGAGRARVAQARNVLRVPRVPRVPAPRDHQRDFLWRPLTSDFLWAGAFVCVYLCEQGGGNSLWRGLRPR